MVKRTCFSVCKNFFSLAGAFGWRHYPPRPFITPVGKNLRLNWEIFFLQLERQFFRSLMIQIVQKRSGPFYATL